MIAKIIPVAETVSVIANNPKNREENTKHYAIPLSITFLDTDLLCCYSQGKENTF
jgi:hypothetical protein